MTKQIYTYGIFNAEPAKLCEAQGFDPEDVEIFKNEIAYRSTEEAALRYVEEENDRREADGTLEKYGPVKAMRGIVTYGDWTELK